jgi:hypothetical protein
VNRKLLVVVAVAAVLALLAGAAVGRNLLSDATTTSPTADVVTFKDEIAKFSISYPGSWDRLALPADDPDVALLVKADAATSLLVRTSALGLDNVTSKTLNVVRKLTDELVAADTRVRVLGDPIAVELGGLPGYRYRYTYGTGTSGGAHDHYFLFKNGGRQLIQLVFQATPAEHLAEVTPAFQRIAGTFRGSDE